MLLKQRAQVGFGPDQVHSNGMFATSQNGAANLRLWGLVRSHGIENNVSQRGMGERRLWQHGCAFGLACFLDFQHFTALIGAALGAGTVRLLAFVTVGALGEANCAQAVMSAAFGGACLGVAPLWICHCKIPFLHAPRAASCTLA